MEFFLYDSNLLAHGAEVELVTVNKRVVLPMLTLSDRCCSNLVPFLDPAHQPPPSPIV